MVKDLDHYLITVTTAEIISFTSNKNNIIAGPESATLSWQVSRFYIS